MLDSGEDDAASFLQPSHLVLQAAQELIAPIPGQLAARAPQFAGRLLQLAFHHIMVDVHGIPLSLKCITQGGPIRNARAARVG